MLVCGVRVWDAPQLRWLPSATFSALCCAGPPTEPAAFEDSRKCKAACDAVPSVTARRSARERRRRERPPREWDHCGLAAVPAEACFGCLHHSLLTQACMYFLFVATTAGPLEDKDGSDLFCNILCASSSKCDAFYALRAVT